MIVTIDGPSGAGKTLTAELVAEALESDMISAGNDFRTRTYLGISEGYVLVRGGSFICPNPDRFVRRLAEARIVTAGRKGEYWLDGVNVTSRLGSKEVHDAVPVVSAIQGVRDLHDAFMRRVAESRAWNVVIEGRVAAFVFAEEASTRMALAFWLDAHPDERKRRIVQRGGEEVAAASLRRDELDQTRAIAPIGPAPWATLIDNTQVSPEDIAAMIVERVRKEEPVASPPIH